MPSKKIQLPNQCITKVVDRDEILPLKHHVQMDVWEQRLDDDNDKK